jgi:lysozyme family protein
MKRIICLIILFLTTTTSMAKFEHYKPTVLKWEGGYAGNIDGMICTNKGVTLATYQAYCKQKGLKKPSCYDLKRIPDEHWDEICKGMFWDKWKADSIISQSIAELLVDWAWGSGIYGIKYPQQVLGVKVDGIVGAKTLAAINNYPDQEELFNKLWQRRKKHFEDIAKSPSKKKFLKGWLNRLNDFKWHD